MADEGVEQGRFTSLKLTDTGYIETSFGNSCRELLCFLGDRFSPKFDSQIGKPQQARTPH